MANKKKDKDKGKSTKIVNESPVNKNEDFKPADVDPMDPAAGLTLTLPTSSERGFLSKARHYKIKGRSGNGPCTVLDKGPVALPNGDLAIQGDTFDPVEERMAPNKYASLLARKYITSAGEKIEKALLTKDA